MTNRKSLLFVLPLLMLVLMACNLGFDLRVVRGKGDLKTEERSVSGFNRVSLAGVGDLNIVQGDEERLTIEAEENLLEYLTTEVRDGELRIGMKKGYSVLPTRTIRFELTVLDIRSIAVSGAGNVRADTLEADEFSMTLSGAGNVNIQDLQARSLRVTSSGTGNFDLAGRVDSQEVTISGAGNYRAADLESSTASLSISGAGNGTLWVNDRLSVKISGFGKVDYYGEPNVNQEISGGGSVNSRGLK